MGVLICIVKVHNLMKIVSICAMWLCRKSVPEDRRWLLLNAPWLTVDFFCFQELIAIPFSQQVETRFNCCFLSVEKIKKRRTNTCLRLCFLLLSVFIVLFYALNPWLFNYRYLVEEIKKREGFQLLLEVSENRAELLLLFGSVPCFILFFLVN